MSVFENVCFDGEIISSNPLGRIASAVNQRPQILDNRSGKGPSHGPSIN
jgi:hypothetical protein